MIFGIFLLEFEREDGFFYFSGQGAFICQNCIFDELLGQGRGAGNTLARKDAIDKGTENTKWADTFVLIKFGIFRRNDGIDKIFWNMIKGNKLFVFRLA